MIYETEPAPVVTGLLCVGRNALRVALSLDPTRDSIEDIAAAGTKAVIFPLWRGFETTCRAFVDASAERETAAILCLDRRSFTEAEWRGHRYLPGLRYWAKRFPDVSCWLVGNEPDQEGESSSPMTRRNFQRLCRNARSVWPEAYLIAGALARVAVSYVDGLEGIVNACAVSIYCQRPADGFPAPDSGFANLCDLLAMFPEGMPMVVKVGR